MKKLIVLMATIALSGCATLTPTQKKVIGVVATAIVIGAIAAQKNDGSHQLQLGAPADQPRTRVPSLVPLHGSAQ